MDRSGVERPVAPAYQAAVHLMDEEGLFRTGLRGRAKIRVPSKPRLPAMAVDCPNLQLHTLKPRLAAWPAKEISPVFSRKVEASAILSG